MSEQLTDWFPGNVKPARPGVYERDATSNEAGHIWSYWDGAFWGVRSLDGSASGAAKAERALKKSGKQCLPWRGLASDPNAPAKPKREPCEWLRWAAVSDLDGPLLCDSRADARQLARAIGSSAIRVRVVEVL